MAYTCQGRRWKKRLEKVGKATSQRALASGWWSSFQKSVTGNHFWRRQDHDWSYLQEILKLWHGEGEQSQGRGGRGPKGGRPLKALWLQKPDGWPAPLWTPQWGCEKLMRQLRAQTEWVQVPVPLLNSPVTLDRHLGSLCLETTSARQSQQK